MHIAFNNSKCDKTVVTVIIMFKRTARYTFFVIIYLSGIVIGGVYTPDVIAYAQQLDVQKNVEKQETQQEPTILQKRRQNRPRIS